MCVLITHCCRLLCVQWSEYRPNLRLGVQCIRQLCCYWQALMMLCCCRCCLQPLVGHPYPVGYRAVRRMWGMDFEMSIGVDGDRPSFLVRAPTRSRPRRCCHCALVIVVAGALVAQQCDGARAVSSRRVDVNVQRVRTVEAAARERR